MKRNTLPGFALALLAFPGLSQAATIDRQAALDSLLAAEKAFADDAAAKGIRDSFLDFLADDGVIFRPDPVNGKEYLRSHPPSPGFLSWVPAYSEISMGGDLGYNTGPYEYREKAGDAEADTGQFATVWQRQADGAWKVLVDLGTAGPAPAPSPTPTPAPPPPAIHLKGPPSWPANALPATKVEAAKMALLAADRTFGEVARAKGGAAAYAAVLCDDARLLRDGVPPVTGKEAVRAAVAAAAKATEPQGWEVAGGGVARSGDFGYTYGVVLGADSGAAGRPVKTANYLRVWRQVADGSWKLAFDVLAPRPKPQPAPTAPAGSPAPAPAPNPTNQTPPTIPPLHPSEPAPPPPGTERG